jgi:hypothetical protein
MEKVVARILLVLQASRRMHRENGSMSPEEIQAEIARKFKKLYRLQEIRNNLGELTRTKMVQEIPASESTSAKFRVTELGCSTIGEVKKYAAANPTGRYAELIRPSSSPNVPPSV